MIVILAEFYDKSYLSSLTFHTLKTKANAKANPKKKNKNIMTFSTITTVLPNHVPSIYYLWRLLQNRKCQKNIQKNKTKIDYKLKKKRKLIISKKKYNQSFKLKHLKIISFLIYLFIYLLTISTINTICNIN